MNQNSKKEISSIYIHIPFCTAICSYCDFCKRLFHEDTVNKYLQALEKEINIAYQKEEIQTIYIGGGTPSSLKIYQLEKLFKIIKKINLKNNIEFSFEMNVNDITQEKLEILKKNNVNRISIGIETTNDKFLTFLNRDHTNAKIIENISLTKKYFDNINVDLMYAFPNQSLSDIKKDLDFIKKLDVPHISLYSLIIEEHTKLYIDKVKTIKEELDAKMYYTISEYLQNLGYKHYEISNFAKEGYESKHNLVYWNNEEYYGFGLGASGYIDNLRYTNTTSINKYIDGIYIATKELVTLKDKMEYEMILGLRKISGVNKKLFFTKYNSTIEQNFDIMDLIEKKLVLEDEDRVYIPLDRLYISNSILINFIGGSSDGCCK